MILLFSRVYGNEIEKEKSEYNMDNSISLMTLGTGLAEYKDKDVRYKIPLFFSYQERSGLSKLISSMCSFEAENIYWFFHTKDTPANKATIDEISFGLRYWFSNPMWKLYTGLGASVIAIQNEIRDEIGRKSTDTELDFGPYIKSGYVGAFNKTFGFDLGIRYDVYNFKKDSILNQPVIFYAGVNYRYCD